MALCSKVVSMNINSRSQFSKLIVLGVIENNIASGKPSFLNLYIFYFLF